MLLRLPIHMSINSTLWLSLESSFSLLSPSLNICSILQKQTPECSSSLFFLTHIDLAGVAIGEDMLDQHFSTSSMQDVVQWPQSIHCDVNSGFCKEATSLSKVEKHWRQPVLQLLQALLNCSTLL